MKENYIFAGRVRLSSGLGYRMYKESELKIEKSEDFMNNSDIVGKSLCWKSAKSPKLWIGEIVEVDLDEKGRFSHKGLGKTIQDENIKEVLRIESLKEEEGHQQELDRKKAEKDSKSIENMTIKELKEFCKKHTTYRFVVKEYLERYFNK